MFNPNSLVKSVFPTQIPPGKLVLDKLTDYSKTRWDEPIVVPSVLYSKFKVPAPPTAAKQPKNYPPSLIDFIKRAYARCKDDLQAKTVEVELRALIAKYSNDLQSMNWETFPIPTFSDLAQKQVSQGEPAGQVKTPAKESLNTATSKEQKLQPNIKINKTLQKLNEKFRKMDGEQGKHQHQQERSFSGFKNQPETAKAILKTNIGKGITGGKEQRIQQTHIVSTNLKSRFDPQSKSLQLPSSISRQKYQHQEFNQRSQPPHPQQSETAKQAQSTQRQSQTQRLQSIHTLQARQRISLAQLPQTELTLVQCITPELPQKSKKQPVSKAGVKAGLNNKQKISLQTSEETVSLQQMAKRLNEFNRQKNQKAQNNQQWSEQEVEEKIVGKSTSIEKPYLRITGRPDPESVRPEGILRKALCQFLEEYKQGRKTYDYLISQLKSIRQDLTVQHIRNAFTVEVYEENLKMSLFEKDSIQLKQCQGNLWQLYRQGIYRTKADRDKFIAYQLITLILEDKFKELEYMLTLLPDGSLEMPQVQDCLRLKNIVILGNYSAFFDYYSSRDEACRCLLNQYIDKIRVKCLLVVSKTFGERISFAALSRIVGEDQDVLEALATSQKATIRGGYFFLKESYEALRKSEHLVTKKVSVLLT